LPSHQSFNFSAAVYSLAKNGKKQQKVKVRKKKMFIFSVLPLCRQIMLNIFQQLRTKCGQRGRERLKMLNLAKNTKICTLRALANISAGPFSH
jgi:hypothetical protein